MLTSFDEVFKPNDDSGDDSLQMAQCPLCGNPSCYVDTKAFCEPTGYVPLCHKCGARLSTPKVFDSMDEAIKAWNQAANRE